MRTREQRVTHALKWHYLDNLRPEEIRDRFADHGVDLTVSTIRDYLSEQEAAEVEEAIEQEHANTRLQIAEHEQELFERARQAEARATTDEPVTAMKPKMLTVRQSEEPLRVSDWERAPPGDDRRPEWATDRDVIYVFTDDARTLGADEEYPAGARHARPGQLPEFRQATVGIERDVVDEKGAAMARQEQSQHLQAKGEALGVYSVDVNLDATIDSESTVSLDEETAAAIRAADLAERGDDE